MNVFVDTSAVLALLIENDLNHLAAVRALHTLHEQDDDLVTTNYVVVETVSLVQHRFGMAPVRAFADKMLPLIQVEWVNPGIHRDALQGFRVANRRSLSLVDCTSFVVMRRLGIMAAFVFDEHFEEQGFRCLP